MHLKKKSWFNLKLKNQNPLKFCLHKRIDLTNSIVRKQWFAQKSSQPDFLCVWIFCILFLINHWQYLRFYLFSYALSYNFLDLLKLWNTLSVYFTALSCPLLSYFSFLSQFLSLLWLFPYALTVCKNKNANQDTPSSNGKNNH